MKQFFPLLLVIIFMSCQPTQEEAVSRVDEAMLLRHLKTLAHDSLQGRFIGSAGGQKTQAYLIQQFDSLGIAAVLPEGGLQPFSHTFSGARRNRYFPIGDPEMAAADIPDTTVTGANILRQITGELDQVIVITAHFDHLGTRGATIYNGADDNASGTAALLTIANYFNKRSPRHTLIFAALDAEEHGLRGAKYLVENFPVDTSKVVLNVNMDMIAHNDSSELFAVGLYHYPELKSGLDNLDTNIKLLFGHDNPNDSTMEDWTYSSDHGEFHKQQIPFLYFGVADHPDYHQPSDTYENINEGFYVEVVDLIIQAIERYDQSLSME